MRSGPEAGRADRSGEWRKRKGRRIFFQKSIAWIIVCKSFYWLLFAAGFHLPSQFFCSGRCASWHCSMVFACDAVQRSVSLGLPLRLSVFRETCVSTLFVMQMDRNLLLPFRRRLPACSDPGTRRGAKRRANRFPMEAGRGIRPAAAFVPAVSVPEFRMRPSEGAPAAGTCGRSAARPGPVSPDRA